MARHNTLSTSEIWDVNGHTTAPHDALVSYPWSQSISWCMVKGYRNGDLRRHVARVSQKEFFTFSVSNQPGP